MYTYGPLPFYFTAVWWPPHAIRVVGVVWTFFAALVKAGCWSWGERSGSIEVQSKIYFEWSLYRCTHSRIFVGPERLVQFSTLRQLRLVTTPAPLLRCRLSKSIDNKQNNIGTADISINNIFITNVINIKTLLPQPQHCKSAWSDDVTPDALHGVVFLTVDWLVGVTTFSLATSGVSTALPPDSDSLIYLHFVCTFSLTELRILLQSLPAQIVWAFSKLVPQVMKTC